MDLFCAKEAKKLFQASCVDNEDEKVQFQLHSQVLTTCALKSFHEVGNYFWWNSNPWKFLDNRFVVELCFVETKTNMFDIFMHFPFVMKVSKIIIESGWFPFEISGGILIINGVAVWHIGIVNFSERGIIDVWVNPPTVRNKGWLFGELQRTIALM